MSNLFESKGDFAITALIGVRMQARERRALEVAAAKAKMTRSAFARSVLRDQLLKWGFLG